MGSMVGFCEQSDNTSGSLVAEFFDHLSDHQPFSKNLLCWVDLRRQNEIVNFTSALSEEKFLF